MANAFEHGGQRFKDAFMAYQRKLRQLMTHKSQYEVGLLHLDPLDVI